MTRQFYRCECFVTHNIFLHSHKLHVKYHNERQFWQDYDGALLERGMKDRAAVLSEVQEEVKRRLGLDETVTRYMSAIKTEYQLLHHDIFSYQRSWFDPSFLELVDTCRSEGVTKSAVIDRFLQTEGVEIYTIPALSPEFCSKFVEELDNFNLKVLKKSRPNTMNTSGVMVDEFGMLGFVNDMIADLLSPVAKVLYPEWYGDAIDSHKSFTLMYALDKDTELKYHYDNAEITFNFCLGKKFSGAEVYFTHMTSEQDEQDYSEVFHQPGAVLIHRARHMHGTKPLLSGVRYNLITWLRSSSIRNKLCPMCNSSPQLKPAVRTGDGFTKP